MFQNYLQRLKEMFDISLAKALIPVMDNYEHIPKLPAEDLPLLNSVKDPTKFILKVKQHTK